jgi:hypothetical protein
MKWTLINFRQDFGKASVFSSMNMIQNSKNGKRHLIDKYPVLIDEEMDI